MWEQALKKIEPLSKNWLDIAWKRIDSLTKPRGSLGLLEEMAARVVAIREEYSQLYWVGLGIERLRNKVIIYDNPETKSYGRRSVIRVAHL